MEKHNPLAALRDRLEFLDQLGLGYTFRAPEPAPKPPEPETAPPMPEAAPGEDSPIEDRFQELVARIRGCRDCPLAESRTQAVPGEGSLSADLMFVGEGPGHDEDVQGRPFVGKAGQLLTKIITAMGFDRGEVYITNIVKCRPPGNRNPNQQEISACRGYLARQLEMIRPRVIVSLGNVPTQFFLGTQRGITSLRGRFFDYDDTRVMPTFHPSYIVRRDYSRDIRRQVWEDMQKVMAFLGKK